MASYVGCICLFAVLFCLPIGDYEHALTTEGNLRFVDAFLFSFQTFSTVGYGVLSPESAWAHAMSVVECIVGFFYMVFYGGILFSRVSTPSQRVVLSDVAIVSGGAEPCLSVRMVNERPSSALLDASAEMSVLVQRGDMRLLLPLELNRSHSNIMRATWSLTHKLGEDSPLHGLTEEVAAQKLLCLVIFVSGTDARYRQPIYAHKVYYCSDLRFDSAFEDVLEFREGEGEIVLDLGRLHSIKPTSLAT